MGFFGWKSRDKSEDECLVYIRQAKREAEKSKKRLGEGLNKHPFAVALPFFKKRGGERR